MATVPMRAVLHSSSYFSPETYAAEQSSIFTRSFHLACLAEDLREEASWIRTEVAGRSVIVQNFGGELRAFLNVCAHRQNRIRTEAAGCGTLRCAYHGWTYGIDGHARAVPERTGFSRSELEGARLTTYQTVRLGPLIFVRPGAHATANAERDLLDQLGPLLPKLSSMLTASGASFERFSLELHCNWKVLVENSIEGYHVASVHPNTIGPLRHRETECTLANGSSLSEFETLPDVKRDRLLARALPQRSLTTDSYFHALVFPNVTVATAQGAFFIITRTAPVAPDACRIDVFLLHAAHRQTEESAVLAPAIASLNADFVKRTFSEDRAICESVQAGLRDSDSVSILHAVHERRVLSFQARVAELLSRP